MPHNNQPDGGYEGYDLFVSPPPPPRNNYGGYPEGGWLLADVGTYANESCRDGTASEKDWPMCTPYPRPDDSWLGNSVDQFSAACWHFAQHLTDQMDAHNEPIIPIGIVGSHWGTSHHRLPTAFTPLVTHSSSSSSPAAALWSSSLSHTSHTHTHGRASHAPPPPTHTRTGGTMVEHWQPNATLNAQVCKNNSGGAYAPWQNKRWDIDSGALFNGQVLPFVNTTIKGALWWQGENNVFQCHDADDGNQKDDSGPGGGPLACGSVEDHTGA
jgi:hypothetical protein